MIRPINQSYNDIKIKSNAAQKDNAIKNNCADFKYQSASNPLFFTSRVLFNPRMMNQQEIVKYNFLVDYLKYIPKTANSFGLTAQQQLQMLFKNGKLLSKSNDSSTMLDNLYLIATTKRADGLNPVTLITNVLDTVSNPRIVTQTFGDIPASEKDRVLNSAKLSDEVKNNPSLINVTESGTCAAASNEVNLADKYPAEFTRWVEGLSSENKAVYLDTKLDSLCANPLDALTILNYMDAKNTKFDFYKTRIKITADDNAYIRANIQTNHWDPGERSVVDVLIQGAIMQAGSQNTYDSLTDTRAGLSNNPQGLIEIEKTFVESLIRNKEITSLNYQQIDDDQNLVGYCCSFDKMEKHIKSALDLGHDVICGYVLTNETAGRVAAGLYNPETDGPVNKVINGHELTIVNYKTDANDKTTFICIDTDDDSHQYVEYSADWLLPKLHHAGFPAKLVEADEREINAKANAV